MQNRIVNRIESNFIVNRIVLNLQKSFLNQIENIWIVNRIDSLSTQRFTALVFDQKYSTSIINIVKYYYILKRFFFFSIYLKMYILRNHVYLSQE